MKVGFLCSHNPYNRNSFSGTPFYMLRALERAPDLEVRVLGGHKPLPRTRIGRKIERTFRSSDLTVPASALEDLDVILAPVGFQVLDALPRTCAVPTVVATDATPGFLREFYGWDIPITHDIQETAALARCDLVIYSSHFMRDLAQQEFRDVDLPPLVVQPFGLNLDSLPAAPTGKESLEKLRLVFIGQEWGRKGGDLAMEAAELLRTRGRNVTLTCIGAKPEAAETPDWLEYLGYLDKNVASDLRVFEEALAKSHILLLPTRADCTPMVIAEANAFGCPVVVTDTGGISSLMDPPRNGRLVPEKAEAAAYADAIEDLVSDPEAYQTVSTSSYAHCRDHLTWDAWATGVTGYLGEMLRTTKETSAC